MARRCRSCSYTTDDAWMDGCPICLSPLVRTGPRPAAAGAILSRRPVLLVGIVAALVVLPAAAGLFVLGVPRLNPGAECEADSTGRVRVGMHMHDVALALEPAWFDPSVHTPLTESFPKGDTRSGTCTWEEGGRLLRIEFRGGRVTGLREGKTGPGSGEAALRISYDD